MQIKKGLDREKKIGLVILVIWFLIGTLFLGFQLQNKQISAVGGGFVFQRTTTVSVNATTNTDVTNTAANIQGIYYVLLITSFAPKIQVSTVADTRSNTYHKLIQSNKYEDNEIWYANYTGTNFASDTITVTFNASTSSSVQYMYLTGVVSGIIQAVKNNGTATTTSVSSFTPNANFACINYQSLNTGSSTTPGFTQPNFWTFSTQVKLLATTFDTFTQYQNNWAGYGATTASTPFTPSSSPQWDNTVACFPEGPAISTTTTTTSTTTTTPTTTTTTTPTTTTTTTTNTTTTSTVTSTTTISSNTTTTTTYTNTTTTSTSVSTITGTVIPEPTGSTDILLIFLAIIIALIMIVAGIRYKTPFPTFIGAVVLMIMDIGLYTNNQIVYGSNIFPTPLWVTEMIALFVIIAFIIMIYQVSKRRY